MKNTEIFTEKADLYSRYRQGYSEKLIHYLYSHYGIDAGSHIADIGSGTGLFSKMLLEQGSTVYGIEPNGSMRLIAERDLATYSSFYSINATGENTHLSKHSINFITVVQSFHWLDTERFKSECRRILKQTGKIAIIYNRKCKGSEINIMTADLIKKFYPDYKDIINHWEIRERTINDFFGSGCEFVDFEHNIVNNLEEFIGRSLSASHSKRKKEYVRELEMLFCNFSQEGIVNIPNDTIAYIGGI